MAGPRHLYFFKSSSVRVRCAAKVEGHCPWLKWEELKADLRTGEGERSQDVQAEWEEKKTELKWTVPERRLPTIRNREPHCSCRAEGMVIFKKHSDLQVPRWLKKTYILIYFSLQTKPNLTVTFMHIHPLSSLSLPAPERLPIYRTLICLSFSPGCPAQILHILDSFPLSSHNSFLLQIPNCWYYSRKTTKPGCLVSQGTPSPLSGVLTEGSPALHSPAGDSHTP